jgi:D-3-phosphoglycerate dehydrogenase
MLKLICPHKDIFDSTILLKYKKYFKCTFLNISQKKFDKISNNYDIILTRFTHYINFNNKNRIKYILSPTTGLTHIDQKFFENSKVKVFNLKNKNFLRTIRASSEFTIFLILTTLRKIKNVNQPYLIGSEINNKLVGVVGLGRIGNSVAKFCFSQGADIIYFDKKEVKNKKYKKTNLKYLLKKSDIIVICIPSSVDNFNFISRDKLKLLKKDAVIINTARGEIIDENYIVKLAKKKFVYYSTDVIQNEQYTKKRKFKKLNKIKNVIATGHIAGLTKESIYKTDKEIFTKFIGYYEKN